MTLEHYPTLPKWPALIVRGESVTKEQAAEILIRTNRWPLLTNNREFEEQVAELIDVPSDRLTWKLEGDARRAAIDSWSQKLTAFGEKYQVLYLNYLHNNQIASSWIGGPHGWVNWRGLVETCNYNIGKWPSVEAVLEDWKNIAAAFPYLNLRCQLLDCEAMEAEEADATPKPLVEFRVTDGKAWVMGAVDPSFWGRVETPTDVPWVGVGGEVGCTLDQLKRALDVTLKSLEAK